MIAAQASSRLAAEHARRGLAARGQDPEFHALLANTLIGVMVMDRSHPFGHPNPHID